MTQKNTKISAPADFYRALFGKCTDCKITIVTFPDKTIRHYPAEELERFISDILQLGPHNNTYFNVNPRAKDLPDGLRGTSSDVTHLCALYSDFDIAGPAHTETNLPKTGEDVWELLNNCPFPPTVIIHTGYGIHAYWILETPLRLDTPASRDVAERTLSGLGRYFTEKSKEHGWKLDNVFDLARVLRAPGSCNHKLKDPVESRIIHDSGIYYTLEDFAEYMDLAQTVPATSVFQADGRTVGSAERIMERCAVAQTLLDDPETVSEPVWHALCSNIALAPDGAELFHEWSSPYSNYQVEETEYKIRRAQSEKKPCSCRYFSEKLGCNCPEGGCGVKAPIAHAQLTKEEQLRNLMARESLTIDDILDPYTLGLLAYAKENHFAEYTRFKARARKAGISVRDLDRAVRQEAEKRSETEFEAEPKVIDLEGISLNGAMEPRGYHITDDGVYLESFDGGGMHCNAVCGEPLVILKRMENIDTGLERMELAFHRNDRWKTLIAPRSDLLSRNSVIRYADHGLPVTSCNSEAVVNYLTHYENENTFAIPFIRSISRIGWLGKEFYPCAVDREIVFEDMESADLIRSMEPHGDYAVWLDAAEKLRKSPFARFFLAASFASVLLELLQHRVILLHCWHASRSGKTAALKFALSVWGDPLRLMGSFNSTAVGLERRAGTLRNLPLGLDELQVLNEHKMSPAQIVYSLGNGIGKTRGSRTGKLQDTPTWRNCVISTGEQPLTRENSMDGVNTRVLEIYGQPIVDPDFGREVHQISENHYGFAGQKFIRYLQQEVLPQRGSIRMAFQKIRNVLMDTFQNADPGVHLDNVAVLALADYYSSLSVFDAEEEAAWEDAVEMGTTMLTNVKSLERQDTVERAWDYVTNWIAANKRKFSCDSLECYGMFEGEHTYVLAHKLREVLEEDGFSYTKCIKGFRERGYLLTVKDSNGVERSQCQKRIQGVNTRVVRLNLTVTPAEFEELDFLA